MNHKFLIRFPFDPSPYSFQTKKFSKTTTETGSFFCFSFFWIFSFVFCSSLFLLVICRFIFLSFLFIFHFVFEFFTLRTIERSHFHNKHKWDLLYHFCHLYHLFQNLTIVVGYIHYIHFSSHLNDNFLQRCKSETRKLKGNIFRLVETAEEKELKKERKENSFPLFSRLFCFSFLFFSVSFALLFVCFSFIFFCSFLYFRFFLSRPEESNLVQ